MSVHYEWMHDEIKHLQLFQMYNFASPLLNSQGYCWWRKSVITWERTGSWKNCVFLQTLPKLVLSELLGKECFTFISAFLVLTKFSDLQGMKKMSKWLCKLSVLSSYPFIYTYFEQASSTDASVFGEHVTKGLKQEGARACTLGEQPFSISGLGVNSWTMGLWLCIHCPLVFRMLTVSLPRDHLASALTNSITLISCSLWFTGPRVCFSKAGLVH